LSRLTRHLPVALSGSRRAGLRPARFGASLPTRAVPRTGDLPAEIGECLPLLLVVGSLERLGGTLLGGGKGRVGRAGLRRRLLKRLGQPLLGGVGELVGLLTEGGKLVSRALHIALSELIGCSPARRHLPQGLSQLVERRASLAARRGRAPLLF